MAEEVSGFRWEGEFIDYYHLILRFVNLKKELRPAVDVEFLVQLCQMFLDCDLGDSEFIGDFLVRPAIPDAADDQLFSWCQRRLLQCFSEIGVIAIFLACCRNWA